MKENVEKRRNTGANRIPTPRMGYTASHTKAKKRYPEKGSARKWDDGIVLYQCFDEGFGVAGEEIDGGKFDIGHIVAQALFAQAFVFLIFARIHT